MTDEEIENQLEETKNLQRFGFMNMAHYEEHKNHVVKGLIKFGGSFAVNLGKTLFVADKTNSLKILRYWNQECEQHAILYKMYLAKEEANV